MSTTTKRFRIRTGPVPWVRTDHLELMASAPLSAIRAVRVRSGLVQRLLNSGEFEVDIAEGEVGDEQTILTVRTTGSRMTNRLPVPVHVRPGARISCRVRSNLALAIVRVAVVFEAEP
jgi:hypothetical protein